MRDLALTIKLVKGRIFPRNNSDLADAGMLIDRAVIGAYAPASPPIRAGSMIACVGSCFADEMAKSLRAQGKPVAHIGLSERWNTPFAVRHVFEFALDGTVPPPGYFSASYEAEAASLRTALVSANAYIITLGLSVCWFERETNRMVLDIENSHNAKCVAEALATHVMKQTTVAENIEQINAIVACIRRSNGSAPVIFTLSPVPLLLSMTDYPPVPSNVISKSVIRSALHDVMERKFENVHYWPSYEIVDWMGKYTGPIWGQKGNDLRHLEPDIIDGIMRKFSKIYFADAAPA